MYQRRAKTIADGIVTAIAVASPKMMCEIRKIALVIARARTPRPAIAERFAK